MSHWMIRWASIRRLAPAALSSSLALGGAAAAIAYTDNPGAHLAAVAGALAVTAAGRALVYRAETRKLRALSATLSHTPWGHHDGAAAGDPMAALLRACDSVFDRLTEYHAERTAVLDLLARILSCSDAAELERVLKRSLRKVFCRDAGAVYFGEGGDQDYRCAFSWRLAANDDAERKPILFTLVAHKPIGMLALYPTPDSLDGAGQLTEDRRLMGECVARIIGLAMSSLELRARLEVQSVRDGLTGLHNRRYFDEAATRELEVARRRSQPMAIALFDIDHFKRFNDEHGHRAGDAVLKEVADVLRSETRKSDVLCRYGGEEFVLLLPTANAEQARTRAEAIVAAARIRLIQHGDEVLGPVTLSGGVAAWDEHGDDLAGVLEAADQALYAAKRGGRDRVCRAAPRAPSGKVGRAA
jgi:diguanylate cyclase (GGDEF)-like protein